MASDTLNIVDGLAFWEGEPFIIDFVESIAGHSGVSDVTDLAITGAGVHFKFVFPVGSDPVVNTEYNWFVPWHNIASMTQSRVI